MNPRGVSNPIEGGVTSSIIGIIVAVIVLGAVLVPICNGMVGNENGGSGGGGGGTQEYVKINDLHEYMAECDWTFPDNIKSFQIYDEDNISELPNLSYDLEYMLAFEQGFSHTGEDYIELSEYLYEYEEGEDRLAVMIGVDEDGVYFTSTLINQSTNQTYTLTKTHMEYVSSFLLTISDSGNDKVMALQIEYTGYNGGTYSNSWVLNKASVISESEDGYIKTLTEYEDVHINVSERCNVLWTWFVAKQLGPNSGIQAESDVTSVFHESDVSDGKWTVLGGSVYDEYTDDTYTDSSVWALESRENGVWQTSISAESMTVLNTQNVDVIQLEGQGFNDSFIEYVGTHGYVGGMADSAVLDGSSAETSGDGSITDTLIQVIPVFVAVAIILAVVGMFYTREQNYY